MLDHRFDVRRAEIRVQCHWNGLTIHVDCTECALLLLFRHGEVCEQMPRVPRGLMRLRSAGAEHLRSAS